MKSVGELLNDLGFNKDAPLETQKTFLKHLVKAAEAPKRPPETPANSFELPAQLSLFDLLPPLDHSAGSKSNKRSA